MRICARCHRPITGQQAYETQDWPSASGPGRTLYRHVRCQHRPPPTQTAPTQYRGYGRG